VDIVFVHGFRGDRERTWAKNGTCWLQSLLPVEVPTARVMTYGYDAYFLRRHGPVVSHRIRDHAVDLLNALASSRQKDEADGRPIIFVVHSLGGLVCKDALLVANSSPEPHLQ
jgi:pimeloyl-ACP methyl ester carboxylesterase